MMNCAHVQLEQMSSSNLRLFAFCMDRVARLQRLSKEARMKPQLPFNKKELLKEERGLLETS